MKPKTKMITYPLKGASLLLLLLFVECKKDSPGPETTGPTPGIVVESTHVATYEIVTLTHSDRNVGANVSAKLGDAAVTLVKTSDSTLSFIVPDIDAGKYTLKSDWATLTFTVSKTTVANADELASSIFELSDLRLSQLAEEVGWDALETAIAHQQEVKEVFQGLTDEQRMQTLLFYQANRKIIDLLGPISASRYRSLQLSADAPASVGAADYHGIGEVWNIQAAIDDPYCPSTNLKSYWTCQQKIRSDAIDAIKSQYRRIVKMFGLAGLSVLMAPTTMLGSIVGAGIFVGLAGHIILVELKPYWKAIYHSTAAILRTKWLFAVTFVEVAYNEYFNDEYTDAGIEPSFETLGPEDTDVNEETTRFIGNVFTLKEISEWFQGVLGEMPFFGKESEPTTLEGATVTVSQISNPNVTYVGHQGNALQFTSSTGDEEEFTYRLKIEKEGFVVEKELKGVVVQGFRLTGVWRYVYRQFIDGTLHYADVIEIDFKDGRGPYGETVAAYSVDAEGQVTSTFPNSFYSHWEQRYLTNLSLEGDQLVLNYITHSDIGEANATVSFIFDPSQPNLLVGRSGHENSTLEKVENN